MTYTRLKLSAPRALLILGSVAAAVGLASLTLATAARAANYSVPVGDYPSTVAVDARTGTVVTANANDDSINVVTKVGTTPVTKTIKVGAHPYGVAIDSATHLIFVSNTDEGTVRIIDSTDLDDLQGVVKVGSKPMGIAIDPANHAVYVANNGDGTVSTFDGTPGATITVYTERVGKQPIGLAIDSGGTPSANHVYVVNGGDNTLSYFDRGIGTTHVVSTVKVGDHPVRVAADQVNHIVYVTDNYDDTVASFNGADAMPVVNFKKVGRNPVDVAVDSLTHAVYVSNLTDNTVTEFGGTSTTETVPVGLNPTGLAVDSASHTVFVANSLESTLSWFPAISFPTITASVLPDAIQGSDYSYQLQSAGTPSPLFAIITSKSSVAPTGLTIDPSSGLLTGPVTGLPGTYRFLINADNGTYTSASIEFVLVVKSATGTPAPTPTPTSTPASTAPPLPSATVTARRSNGGSGRDGQLASTGLNELSFVPIAVGLVLLGIAGTARHHRLLKRARRG